MANLTSDIEAILARRHDNGADYWASPEGKVYVGNPFSTIGCLGMLHELGLGSDHEAVAGSLELLLDACRDDGRIRLGPKTPMYPCYTAEAARMLCRFGLADDRRVRRTIGYLLEGVHPSGGWRCNFTRFGKGRETEVANPGATLMVLDALRFVERFPVGSEIADGAVDFLLDHWDTRAPLGPCHWGIGTTFMQIEFPFVRYNVFYYTYVLSFYERARRDPRLLAAVVRIEESVDENDQLVVERPHRSLKGLRFCARGEPSTVATERWREIRENLARV